MLTLFKALLAEVHEDVERSSEGLILLDGAMSLVEKGDLRSYEAEHFRLKVSYYSSVLQSFKAPVYMDFGSYHGSSLGPY